MLLHSQGGLDFLQGCQFTRLVQLMAMIDVFMVHKSVNIVPSPSIPLVIAAASKPSISANSLNVAWISSPGSSRQKVLTASVYSITSPN